MADNKTVKLKTYILQFTYKDGNGYAIVNATSPTQAEKVFLTQTRYKGATVVNLKESKWYGENMQVVYEGAVTTYANISVNVDLDALIQSGSLYRTFEDWVRDKLKLDDYVTQDELNDALAEIDISSLLSNYYTKEEVDNLIPNVIMPNITIDPITLTWVIDGKPTQISAQGPAGDNGTFDDLTEAQKESLRGPAGNGISNITTQFTLTANSSPAPSTGWSNTPQTPTSTNKYLWSRLVITYDNNTIVRSTPYIVGNYSSGGSGGGISVDTAVDGQTEFDDNTLYFFSPSPSQSVGLYNTLLQEGHLDDLYYSPGTLYQLDRNINFEVVDDDSLITFDRNVVYCNNQPTMLKQFGSVLLSSIYKYAETLLGANLTLRVSGPFFVDTTYVKLTFSGDIRVMIKEDSQWVEKHSGDVIEFTYDDFFIPRDIQIFRDDVTLNNSNYTVNTSLEVPITFTSYYDEQDYTEDVICRVKFSKGKLFFSSDLQINNINDLNFKEGNTPNTIADWIITQYSGSRIQVRNHTTNSEEIDQRLYNRIYVKCTPVSNTTSSYCSIFVTLNGWKNASSSLALPICYYTVTSESAYYTVPKWGYRLCTCSIYDNNIKRYERVIDNMSKINDGANNYGIIIDATGNQYIYEIGLMTYEEPNL